jgi:rhodanese-related sulfurtransferase
MNHDEGLITLDELLRRARSGLTRVRSEELEREAAQGSMLVDVRTAEQRARDGDLPGAHVIDLTVLEWRLAPSSGHRELEFPPDRRVILVCSQGDSSSLAAARLQQLGLVNVTDLEDGFESWKAWKDAGG